MLSAQNFTDLEVKGYTVVSNVLSVADCDKYIDQYNTWLQTFKKWPKSRKGIIHGDNSGHQGTTWQIRLHTRPVFAQIWKTDKLLSSFDSVAIGRPPEDGEEPFDDGKSHWLHLDQESNREGLHAYQGGVYLEEACQDDWTLQVMENSHRVFQKFFDQNPKAAEKSAACQFFRLTPGQVKYFEKNGCKTVRVAVPKGGMVLWDSRLVHANAQPLRDRTNPGRWRYVAFVSMTPAVWASGEDIDVKREAYLGAKMTNHWSSEGSTQMKASLGTKGSSYVLPREAQTTEAQLIAGIVPYDFADGNPNGPPKPKTKAVRKRTDEDLAKGY